MAELRERILSIQPCIIKHSFKLYYENGFCHSFSWVHQNIMKAMDGHMGNKEDQDVQYPCSEDVTKEYIYLALKIL